MRAAYEVLRDPDRRADYDRGRIREREHGEQSRAAAAAAATHQRRWY